MFTIDQFYFPYYSKYPILLLIGAGLTAYFPAINIEFLESNSLAFINFGLLLFFFRKAKIEELNQMRKRAMQICLLLFFVSAVAYSMVPMLEGLVIQNQGSLSLNLVTFLCFTILYIAYGIQHLHHRFS